jgi:hypothetical protein
VPTDSLVSVGVKPKAICFLTPGPASCDCITNGTNCSAAPQAPVVTGDTAQVWCGPRSVVRGTVVGCKIYVGRPQAFDVTQRTTVGVDVGFAISGGADTGHVAGDTAVWNGILVASSIVSATVNGRDASGVLRSLFVKPDTVTVTARTTFTPYTITRKPVVINRVDPTTMTRYPLHYVRGNSGIRTATFGRFKSDEVGLLDSMKTRAALLSFAQSVESGPNRGLVYFRRQPPIRDSTEIWIHPALSVGSTDYFARTWYREQDSSAVVFRFPSRRDTSLTPGCNAKGVAHLDTLTRQHEGQYQAMPSHYSVLQQQLNSSKLAATLEAYVMRGSTDDFVSQVIGFPLNDFWDGLSTAQHALELTDYDGIFGPTPPDGQPPTSPGTLGCYLHYSTVFPAPTGH